MISFSLLGLLVDGGDEFLALFTRARVMCTIVAWISPDPEREKSVKEHKTEKH